MVLKMHGRGFVLCAVSLVCFGYCSGAVRDVASCTETHDILSRFQFRDPFVNIPSEPTNDEDLRICQSGMSCCTRELEQQLTMRSRNDYHTTLQSAISFLRYTLSSAAIDFQGEYEDLLQYGEDRVQQHFRRTYPGIASEMHGGIQLLFADMQAYLQGFNVDIEQSTEVFFNDLFPHVYSTILNSGVGRLDKRYKDCLRNRRTVIRPFRHHDNAIGSSLQNSLKISQVFIKSLNLGLEVLNNTEHMDLSRKCKLALMKMKYCPLCQGLGSAKPCQGYCLNVMKGCLANFMDLDLYWTEYVTSVVGLIRQSMTVDYDLQQVMHSLDTRINEAINYASDNRAAITHSVLEQCGPPPLLRQNMYNDFAHNEPPINVPIAPNPSIPLDERLLLFVQSLDNSRGMYRSLPESLCLDMTSPQHLSHRCWNGNSVGRYQEDVVEDGTVAQQWNPEVPLTGREPELLQALILMDKLRHVSRMVQTTLISLSDEEEMMISGSGSGSIPGSGCGNLDDEDCGEGSGDMGDNRGNPRISLTTGPTRATTTEGEDFQFDKTRDPKDQPYKPVGTPRPTSKVGDKKPGGGAASTTHTVSVIIMCCLSYMFVTRWR